MTIYTPGGMPINFPMNYAFTLLARLYPRYRPHKVLKIAQGMDKAPEAVRYSLAFILFAIRLSPVMIFASVLIVPVILYWMHIRHIYLDLVVNSGVLFTTVGKFGVISIGLAVFGYYSLGWQGLAAFFSARLVGGFINIILEVRERNRIRALAGFGYNVLDRCFIDAYQFCANKIGVTIDPYVSEQEIESSRWQIVYMNYSQQNPVLFEMMEFS